MKINKNQFVLSTGWEDFKFSFNRGRGHMLRYLSNRFKWHYFPRLRWVASYPLHIDCEIASACNMSCPMCYRHKYGYKSGLMDFSLFKKIVDESAENKLFSMRLSWRGEVLLHPKIIDMIKYAKDSGIKEVAFLTNALALDEKIARKIVETGVDWVTISFDGLGKTYEGIRKPAIFEEAVGRIRKLHEIKKELGKKKPVVNVQTIWPAIEKDPDAYYKTFKNIVDKITVNPFKDYYNAKIVHDPNYICPVLWQRLTITCFGEIAQCICDTKPANILGDAGTDSIKDVWRGKKMNEIRKLHAKKKRLNLKTCSQCHEGCIYEEKDVITKNGRKIKQFGLKQEYEREDLKKRVSQK